MGIVDNTNWKIFGILLVCFTFCSKMGEAFSFNNTTWNLKSTDTDKNRKDLNALLKTLGTVTY